MNDPAQMPGIFGGDGVLRLAHSPFSKTPPQLKPGRGGGIKSVRKSGETRPWPRCRGRRGPAEDPMQKPHPKSGNAVTLHATAGHRLILVPIECCAAGAPETHGLTRPFACQRLRVLDDVPWQCMECNNISQTQACAKADVHLRP